ncbi:MAG TPA: nicotinate phosphoribosyltransferase [Polyangiaceae bacterium]
MNTNPMLLADFYKIAHRKMYPPGTELVYSTWTPRGSRVPGCSEFVWFGLQAFLKHRILDQFQRTFFEASLSEVTQSYRRIITNCLGDQDPDVSHIEQLWHLGYLPLRIRALDEGTVVPLRMPVMTLENTDPRFFWLTNYIETLMSVELWQPSTSATIARRYRKAFDAAALATVGSTDFCQFQGHDFSMRGMGCLEAAIGSGMGHLLSFAGTDTIPAIEAHELYYGANVEKELVGTSVPATEHSVQCAYGDDEEYIRHIITNVHPSGIVSVVSDGYDFWDVMTRILPSLKDVIMVRDGKLVIRPDSGDPVKIICGDPRAPSAAERAGAIEVLWNTFGGTVSERGYRCLDPHVGLIYGDAITLGRQGEILARLAEKRFASTNVVLGIGSYTYQYQTRDSFGLALKSTLVRKNGGEVHIFKTPKTDDGTKNSQRGRVAVRRNEDGTLYWTERHRLDEHVPGNLLVDVFRDGKLVREHTLSEIRARVAG